MPFPFLWYTGLPNSIYICFHWWVSNILRTIVGSVMSWFEHRLWSWSFWVVSALALSLTVSVTSMSVVNLYYLPHRVVQTVNEFIKVKLLGDFPGGAVVQNLPANARTWVPSLVWEDPTCRRATKPMCHNYWACALEPVSHNYWACEPRIHCNEKPTHHNEE